MEIYFILMALALITSWVLLIVQPKTGKIEFYLVKVATFSLIGVIISLILLYFGYRFRGVYTTFFIWMTFIVSSILLFGLTSNWIVRLLTGGITVPATFFGLISL